MAKTIPISAQGEMQSPVGSLVRSHFLGMDMAIIIAPATDACQKAKWGTTLMVTMRTTIESRL